MTRERRHPQPEITLPRTVILMRPQVVTDLPSDPENWISEPKWNGVRVAILIGGSTNVRILIGGKDDVAVKLPELVKGFSRIGIHHSAIIDGEIIRGQGTKPEELKRVQDRIKADERIAKILSAKFPLRFVAVDLLFIDGTDLRTRTIDERKGRLARLFTPGLTRNHDMGPTFFDEDHDSVIRTARTLGNESIVLKRRESHYKPSIQKNWQLYKVR